MKKNNLFKIGAVLVFGIFCLYSCVKDPDIKGHSEVEIPGGAVNYFENPMDFGFEGGDKVMSFKVNLKWSMKTANTQNGLQWLIIDPTSGNSGNNKVLFSAQENPTYEDRSVVVQFSSGDTIRNIRVNQKRLEAITLTSDIFEVPVDGGKIDVEVNHSTSYNYTIPEVYKTWIHASPNATRGLDSSKVSFIIDPSDEYEKREGRIYFTARDEEEVVTVYQAGSGKLILSKDEYNLSEAEQSFTVDISSNFDFGIEMPDAEWLIEDVNQTRGMSSHTLKFKVTKNNDYNARSAKIKFFDKNSKLYETVVVNQASIGAAIILEKSEYSVTSGAQDLDIEVKSNFDYNVDFQGANWIKQRKNNTRGITERLLKLHIDENKNKDARTATIKLYDKNSSAAELITITQNAKSAIEVQTKQFSVDELKNIITVMVNANADYNLTPNNDWIHAGALTRGLNTNEHQFTIDALNGADDREGTITVSNDDLNFSENITIKQRNTFYFETKNVEILMGKEKALSLKNLTNPKQDVVWSSSEESVATVSDKGVVKASSTYDGTVTVKAKTTDGQHVATCTVKVCKITDMISVKGGGTVSIDGNLVKAGSQIKWTIKNNSPVKVKLMSMQLIDGETNEAGNEMEINEDIAAGSSVTKTTNIEGSGIHFPVKCKIKMIYNNSESIIIGEFKKPNI